MNDERDELLKEIGAALSIEPTPEFAAQVRTQVDREPMVSPWRGYVIGVAGAAIVLLAIAGSLSPRRETAAIAPPTSRVPAAVSVEPAAQPRASRSVMNEAGTDARPRSRTVVARPARVPSRQVPVSEAEAFWRVVARVQNEGMTLPSARWPIREETGEVAGLPEIAAIHVPALKIDPLPGSVEFSTDAGGWND